MEKGYPEEVLEKEFTKPNPLKNILNTVGKTVESVLTFGIENISGQRYEPGDLGRISQFTYLRSLEKLDEKGISPNRLVTIRVAIVLAGGTTLFIDPNLPQEIKSALEILVLAGLLGDRVDGDLARYTNQCTPEGATLDAGADKVITIPSLTAISLYQIVQNCGEMFQTDLKMGSAVVILAAGTLALAKNDIDSQAKRTNNWEAAKAFWTPPILKSERKPAKKTENDASMISKMKTVLQMLVIAGYIKQESITNLTGMPDDIFNLSAATMLGVAFVCGQKGQKQRTTQTLV